MPRRERNKFVKRGQILELSIEDYAFGGKGIARIRSEGRCICCVCSKYNSGTKGKSSS